MEYRIHHEIPGRIRIKLAGPVPDSELDALIKVIDACPAVRKIQVYGRIGQVALEYDGGAEARERTLRHLKSISRNDIEQAKAGYAVALAPRTHA